MKKFLSLVMTALLILSVAVMPASAEADKTLKFNEDGKFTIMNIAGQIIDEVPIENFQNRPRVTFEKIKKMVK